MSEHAHSPAPGYRFIRRPALHGHHRVSFVELFFDLVFVFAVTQLSHGLIQHPSWVGLLETAMLTMAVWWVWIYTSWATNWADPDKTPVRVMLFLLMLAGLVMSMAIPKAFETRAMAFALAYTCMQVGRSAFMLLPMREYSKAHERSFLRLLIWMVVSACFWIGGAALGGKAQIGLWLVAIAIEYAGPAMRFATPGLGRSATSDWDIEPEHFAERCGLFMIIALGESVLVAGATFANLEWTFAPSMAFFAAFLGTVAMWLIYFNIGQARGAVAMKGAVEPGVVARGYTYVHLIIVAGIIVTAVADEFVLMHADGHVDGKTVGALVGGAVLYLVGCLLFKRTTAGWFPLSHMVGTAALLVLVPFSHSMTPWQLSLLTSLVLAAVAVWERISLGPDGVQKIGHPSKRKAGGDHAA